MRDNPPVSCPSINIPLRIIYLVDPASILTQAARRALSTLPKRTRSETTIGHPNSPTSPTRAEETEDEEDEEADELEKLRAFVVLAERFKLELECTRSIVHPFRLVERSAQCSTYPRNCRRKQLAIALDMHEVP